MKGFALIFAGILFVAGVFAIVVWQRHNDEEYIRSYHSNRKEVVLSIDQPLFRTGPFWFKAKNDRIYIVTTDNGIYWWRRGWSDSLEQEYSDRKYTPIK